MKTIFASLLLSLVAASAFGQDGKPTKAQTIEYIQTHYPKELGYVASMFVSDDLGHLAYEGKISDITIGINGTQVTVTYLSTLAPIRVSNPEPDREQYLITFDMKDIEAIEGMCPNHVGMISYEDAEFGDFPMYLLFVAAKGESLVEVTINGESKRVAKARVPFSLDDVKTNSQVLREFKNWQLYKAFEHLRKLSGGPEPVRF